MKSAINSVLLAIIAVACMILASNSVDARSESVMCDRVDLEAVVGILPKRSAITESNRAKVEALFQARHSEGYVRTVYTYSHYLANQGDILFICLAKG